MKENGPATLEKELGATPPAALHALSNSERDDLASAVREAKRRQRAALATAAEQALAQIPRVLRGPIRRMFR